MMGEGMLLSPVREREVFLVSLGGREEFLECVYAVDGILVPVIIDNERYSILMSEKVATDSEQVKRIGERSKIMKIGDIYVLWLLTSWDNSYLNVTIRDGGMLNWEQLEKLVRQLEEDFRAGVGK
jgi:hypothetical protein